MKKYFVIIPLFILFSCGNPIIEDEYGKISGLGDNKLYIIKSESDISKLHAHPDGTFIFELNDDIEMDTTVAEVFTGKMYGTGPGRVLVPGMMFTETNGAIIKDILFFQNGGAGRGVSNVGMVTGVARNTQFINVRVEGGVATSRTGGMDVFVGGIAGKMDARSVITRSSSEAAVSFQGGGVVSIGGLVGFNEGGEISYSYAHGTISGSAEDTLNAGGLAGFNSGKIFDSYYALSGGINVNAGTTTNAGGLVGDSSAGIIENSYSSTGSGVGVTDYAGVAPASPEKVYHNKTPFTVADFSSNPSYWSFDTTFQDGDIGGVPSGPSVSILPRLINNPDRFIGPWR